MKRPTPRHSASPRPHPYRRANTVQVIAGFSLSSAKLSPELFPASIAESALLRLVWPTAPAPTSAHRVSARSRGTAPPQRPVLPPAGGVSAPCSAAWECVVDS